MEKKIDLLRKEMLAGNWQKALSIASKFPRLGLEKEAIIRGHEAYEHPNFYKQIKKNPDTLIEEGIAALKKRYGDPSEPEFAAKFSSS